MKKKTLRIVTFILALAMLSGCSKNQEQTEPTSINQAMLIEKSAQEQESYSFPGKFTGDWTSQEGKLTIHADAQVVAEQGLVLPTATVEPREFTQEDVDNLLRVFLKGEPLYSYVQTKQELQDWLDYINSPEWQSDPAKPNSPEQLEKRRKELNDWYNAEIAKAPDEKPIVHGFADSGNPNEVSGYATLDGVKYDINIRNEVGGFWTSARIIQNDYKYRQGDEDWGNISKEDAIAQANALMQELGLDNMALDDVRPWWENDGTWDLYYTPTVNGIRISSICEERVWHEYEDYEDYQYWVYSCSEATNPDTVSWVEENIGIVVGKGGILSFTWFSPSAEPVVKESQTALMSFDEIASIANTMLPVVVIGPKETSLVDLDRINGFDTHMDVEITKVSLTLMRIRDKGSLQGTIVPVWDFWGTWNWYEPGDGASDTMRKGVNYTTQPMLTLNAIDGNVVNRQLGY